MMGVEGFTAVKDTSHQLIVIGNGFDLACGLKSGFSDFFEPRMEALGACRELSGDSQFEKMLESGITAWDIVLSASYPGFVDRGRADWCDVESAIEHVVRPASLDDDTPGEGKRPHLDIGSIEDATFDVRKAMPGTKENEQAESGFGGFRNLDIFEHFDLDRPVPENKELAKYLIWKHPDLDDWDDRSILRLLLAELRDLEGAFEAYLSRVVGESESYTTRSAAMLRELVAAEGQLFHDGDEVRTTLLSFNYTTPGLISLRNMAVNETVHVHGKLGEGVVFGIDGTDCLDDVDALRYTKTYRLLGSAGSHPTNPVAYPPSTLLGGTETVAIKFYGHSLAKADYAYFQSMFDMAELYGGNVTLCFYYSDYCAEEEERTYERVTNLLASYGRTMDNKDHGKNLIHKLLLENRLIVRPL